MLRQIREFGVGMCVVDQHPSLMSLPALGTYCTVAFNLRLRPDREAMASALNLEKTEYLGRLPERFAIVKIQDRFLSPFLIKTFDVRLRPELPPVKPPEVDTRKYPVPRVSWEGNKVVRGSSEVSRVVRYLGKRGRPVLWEEVFLCHMYAVPLMATSKRYERLGLNVYQGNKIRRSMLSKGLITIKDVSTKTGRTKVMTPTVQGCEWLSRRGMVTRAKLGGVR